MNAAQALEKQRDELTNACLDREAYEPTEAEIEERIFQITLADLDTFSEAIGADGVHDVFGEKFHTETHPRYLKRMHELVNGGLAEALDLQTILKRQVNTYVRLRAVKELIQENE